MPQKKAQNRVVFQMLATAHWRNQEGVSKVQKIPPNYGFKYVFRFSDESTPQYRTWGIVEHCAFSSEWILNLFSWKGLGLLLWLSGILLEAD